MVQTEVSGVDLIRKMQGSSWYERGRKKISESPLYPFPSPFLLPPSLFPLPLSTPQPDGSRTDDFRYFLCPCYVFLISLASLKCTIFLCLSSNLSFHYRKSFRSKSPNLSNLNWSVKPLIRNAVNFSELYNRIIFKISRRKSRLFRLLFSSKLSILRRIPLNVQAISAKINY